MMLHAQLLKENITSASAMLFERKASEILWRQLEASRKHLGGI